MDDFDLTAELACDGVDVLPREAVLPRELILTDAGYTVVSARNGVQGVQLAACEQPDLILMDLRLPLLDGWEATRRIKANPATRHIPVVACTAYAMQEDLTRAVAAGSTAVIAKPFELNTLLNNVAAALAQNA